MLFRDKLFSTLVPQVLITVYSIPRQALEFNMILLTFSKLTVNISATGVWALALYTGASYFALYIDLHVIYSPPISPVPTKV